MYSLTLAATLLLSTDITVDLKGCPELIQGASITIDGIPVKQGDVITSLHAESVVEVIYRDHYGPKYIHLVVPASRGNMMEVGVRLENIVYY